MTERLNDIREKLDFILEKHEQLITELKKATTQDIDIKNLGIKVGEILGGCRECLDYCIKDIAHQLTPGYIENNPSERFYFPLSSSQIKRNKGIFKEIEKKKPEEHKALIEIARKIEYGAPLDGLGFHYNYSIIKIANELVNDKKHNKITETRHLENAKTLVEFSSGVQVKFSAYRIKDDGYKIIPGAPVATNQSASKRLVKEFFIGDHEVDRICESTIKATAAAIFEAYESVIKIEDPEVNPWELRKSEEDRLGDQALKRLSPISYTPIAITLCNDSGPVIITKYNSKGETVETPERLYSTSKLFLELFNRHTATDVDKFFREHIKENWKKMTESNTSTARCFEYEEKFKENNALVLDDGETHIFNKIIFGIQCNLKTKPERMLILNEDQDKMKNDLKKIANPPHSIKIHIIKNKNHDLDFSVKKYNEKNEV